MSLQLFFWIQDHRFLRANHGHRYRRLSLWVYLDVSACVKKGLLVGYSDGSTFFLTVVDSRCERRMFWFFSFEWKPVVWKSLGPILMWFCLVVGSCLFVANCVLLQCYSILSCPLSCHPESLSWSQNTKDESSDKRDMSHLFIFSCKSLSSSLTQRCKSIP